MAGEESEDTRWQFGTQGDVGFGDHLLVDGAGPSALQGYDEVAWPAALSAVEGALWERDPFFWDGIRRLFLRDRFAVLPQVSFGPEDDEDLVAWLRSCLDPVQPRLRVFRRRPPAPIPIAPSPFDLPLDEPPPPLHDFEIEVYDQDGKGYSGVVLEVVDSEKRELKKSLNEHGYLGLTSLQPGSCDACTPVAEQDEPREAEHTALVSVVFKGGMPAAGAVYELTLEGGDLIRGALDESGLVHAEWTGASSGTIALPELRTTTVELTGGVAISAGSPLSLVAEQPPVCTRLTGFLFDTDKSFLLPGAIPAMAEIRAHYAAYPTRDVEVVGHADTAGSAGHNQTLSEERAKATVAFLTDDADAWLAWYGAGMPESKRWGDREDLLMLGSLPDAAARGPEEHPVSWYQRSRGLPETGSADAVMRKQLITEYMAADGTTLPVGVTIKARGAGETEPLVDTGDGQDEPLNRRVEIFFCEPGKPAPKSPKPKPRDKPKPKDKPEPDEPELHDKTVPATPEPVVLEAIAIEAFCSHEKARVAAAGGILKVVGDASTGDKISVHNTRADDVTWTLDQGSVAVVDARSGTFNAKPGVIKSAWPISLEPVVYTVTGKGKKVEQSITVHAYPATEIAHQWAVDKDIVKALKTGADLVKKPFKVFLGIELDIIWPSGELALSGQWLEGSSADQAKWTFKVSGKMVFLGIQGKYALGSDRLRDAVARIPGIGEYIGQVVDWLVKANAFIAASGDIHVSASYDSLKATDNTIATVASTTGMKLGVEAKVAGGECIMVEADVGASVVPSGGLKWDDKGVFLQLGLKFGGLKGAVTIKLAWGLLAYQESWTLIDECTIYPNADSPAGAGAYYLPGLSNS